MYYLHYHANTWISILLDDSRNENYEISDTASSNSESDQESEQSSEALVDEEIVVPMTNCDTNICDSEWKFT